MMKKLTLSGAALLAAAAVIAPSAATAQRYGYNGYGYEAPRYEQSYDGRGDQGRDRYAGRDAYQNRDAYQGRDPYQNRYGYDRPGYRPARCNNGTGGTIIGAIAGGLLGRTIDTRGDRTLGTVLGAGAGALAGNAIGRSGNPGYCRR